MSEKESYIYILTNKNNTVLYTGITSNLIKRVHEHKEKMAEGFTKKFNLSKLVYFERHDSISNAIEREKQIKAGTRKKKMELIDSMNPRFSDLYEELLESSL